MKMSSFKRDFLTKWNWFYAGLVVAFIIVVGLLLLAIFWSGLCKEQFFSGPLGGFLTALITLLLACIAYTQLSSMFKTSSADFTLRLKRDFFTVQTRKIIQLFDSNWLLFKYDGELKLTEALFVVNKEMISESGLDTQQKKLLTRKDSYSTYELDDLVLGHLEDIGFLLKTKVVKIDFVYELFSYYVETVWENREIKRYIHALHVEKDPDFYENLKYLYSECKRFQCKRFENDRSSKRS